MCASACHGRSAQKITQGHDWYDMSPRCLPWRYCLSDPPDSPLCQGGLVPQPLAPIPSPQPVAQPPCTLTGPVRARGTIPNTVHVFGIATRAPDCPIRRCYHPCIPAKANPLFPAGTPDGCRLVLCRLLATRWAVPMADLPAQLPVGFIVPTVPVDMPPNIFWIAAWKLARSAVASRMWAM